MENLALDLNYAADLLWKTAKPPQLGWGKSLKSLQAKFLRPVEPDWVKVIKPFILLKGYAIENLVKGLCVKQKKEMGQVIPEGDSLFDMHISVPLFKKSGIPLSDQENGLIERLAVYVRWAARYLIAKNTKKNEITWFITGLDLELIDHLIQRLQNELE